MEADMEKMFFSLFIVLTAFFLVNCENSVNSNENTDIQPDIENSNPYIDVESGVQWTETIGTDLTAAEAAKFCKNMNEMGYTDYTLPTVEQLWTLVTNCDDIQKCPDATDGRYSKLEDSGRLWSRSSEYITDIIILKSPYPVPLYLDFDKLEEGYEDWRYGKYKVRCVREHSIAGKTREDQPCSPLPANGLWNSVDKITQIWSGTEWLPSTEAQYNEESSTKECRFKCKEGFINHDNSCVEPELAEKWSKRSLDKAGSVEAFNYCKNLEENGHSDWRLPTVSEMRNIVINCPDIETQGECGITDECLDRNECWNNKCSGCGIIIDKRYSKFWDTESFYTSSPNTSEWESEWNIENDTDFYFSDTWVVDFSLSRIMNEYAKFQHHVRCIR